MRGCRYFSHPNQLTVNRDRDRDRDHDRDRDRDRVCCCLEEMCI